MEVRKRSNESTSSLIYRFSKKTQQSGILKEAKKRRYFSRPTSRLKLRLSAINRARRKAEFERKKKLGLV